jgi:hypothetical protein
MSHGNPRGIRTHEHPTFNQVLYQPSYWTAVVQAAAA